MKILVLACCLAACTVSLGDGERRITAREITVEVIVPTLDDVVTTAEAQVVAIRALATTPAQAELDAAQEAWRAARVPWKASDAFGFGPAKDMSLTASIDQVIDPAKVDLEVTGTSVISAAYVETIGANRKGFHAIELLMFRGGTQPEADAAVLASLTTEPNADRRLALLVAYAENLEAKARILRDAWAAGYAARIAGPGSANADYPTIKAVIDTLTNESVFQSELIADARLGKPMGTGTGGIPQPLLEESAPSDNSIADMTSAILGIRNIYFGARTDTPGKGIGKLVAAQSPSTDRDVRLAIADALAAIATIPRPYQMALLEQRPEVATAHLAVKELKRILATEVVGVLGATLKFNDNDGD